MTKTTKNERMLANISSPKRAMLALLPRRPMSAVHPNAAWSDWCWGEQSKFAGGAHLLTGMGYHARRPIWRTNLELELAGRVAIVGGSSKGIGFAAATSLAREGAGVAIVARHTDDLEQAAADIKAATGTDDVLPVAADLANADDIQRVFDSTMERWGRVDVVLNNLGGPPPGELQEFTDDQWHTAFELNFQSAVRLNRLVVPGMRERKHGRILGVLSKTIKEPEDRLGLSTVARTAMSSYSKLLAQEVIADGITVNNVLPGSVATGRLTSVIEAQAKANNRTVEQTALRVASVPAGRFAEPHEVGDLIAFLASSRAGYITGQNIAVDGGKIKGLS